jgi:hypothetical protein
MTTLEDFQRAATQFGEVHLAKALAPITRTRTPADLLAECERAAGIAMADTTSTKETAP